MRIPKKYGQYKVDNCPFCGKRALTENAQGAPVCLAHKDKELSDLKCACGEWLDLRTGKFGAYFNCIRCGNINFRKGLEMNPQLRDEPDGPGMNMNTNTGKSHEPKPCVKGKRDIVITSDEVDIYF